MFGIIAGVTICGEVWLTQCKGNYNMPVFASSTYTFICNIVDFQIISSNVSATGMSALPCFGFVIKCVNCRFVPIF